MKAIGIVIVLSLIALSIGTVNALQPASISLTIPSNANSIFNISFYNNATQTANVTIDVAQMRIEYSAFFSGIGVKPTSFTLAPGQSQYVLFSFNPTQPPYLNSHLIMNVSYTLNGVQKNLIIYAAVVPVQNLISKLNAPASLKPTSPLVFNVTIINALGQDAVIPIAYTLNASNGAEIAAFSGTAVLTNLGTDEFTFSIPLNETLLPGTYNLSFTTNYGGQSSGSASKLVEILPYTAYTSSSSSDIGIFGGTVTTTITNTGNKNISQGNLTLSISKFNSVFLSSKYSSLGSPQISGLVLSTSLAALAPGQTLELSYTVSYLPIYLIVIIIVAAVLVFLYFNRKVIITKEVVEHKVVEGFVDVKLALKVRNVSKKPLKSLTITDFVPPNALKVHAVGPKEARISKVATGLNIIWKEVELQPNDEILLMYEIKSKLGIVGNIYLKPAMCSFAFNNKNYTKKSNSLVLNIK
jgi:hypothetical protein